MKKAKCLILCGLVIAVSVVLVLCLPQKMQGPDAGRNNVQQTEVAVMETELLHAAETAETTPLQTESAEEKLRELGVDEIDEPEPSKTSGTTNKADNQQQQGSADSTPTQPKPTEPQPKPTEPQPKPTEPQPKPTEPQPKPTEPQPTPTEPQPTPTEPQPKPTEPQPKPTEPQPKPTGPDDGSDEDYDMNMGETDWD